MSATALGVTLMLLAVSLANVGAVVQKGAVDELPPFDQQPVVTSIKQVLRSPAWLIGWVMATAGIVLNMVAVGVADISVVQPLNGFGLVVLAVFSRLWLGEHLEGRGLAGVGAIIAGVVLVGATSPPSREFTGAAELLGSYVQPLGAGLLLALGATVVGLKLLGARLSRGAGIVFALAGAVASVTGLTFAKGFFGLWTLAGLGETVSRWEAWLLLALLLTFSSAAMMLQQLSLQKGRAVVVTTVFFATAVVLPLASGALVFGEALAPMSLLAAAIITAGVILLGSR